jgi:hypothetical protein
MCTYIFKENPIDWIGLPVWTIIDDGQDHQLHLLDRDVIGWIAALPGLWMELTWPPWLGMAR